MSHRSNCVGGGEHKCKIKNEKFKIFEEVISLENLFTAWKKFSCGKMGKSDVCAFAVHLEDNLFVLHEDLRDGIYGHGQYEHFFVHDPKRRYISKATVQDRIVHQAIVQVVEPFFERRFVFDSYSSRKGKGTHAAVERLEKFLRQASRNYHRKIFALKCDIRKFFDSVRHDVLISIIKGVVNDQNFNNLIWKIINSYSVDKKSGVGLPLGNVTSQLFANIYLNGFDHFIKERVRARWYLRFCDDFVVLHWDKRILEIILSKLEKFLFCERQLCLHPEKVSIRKFFQGIDFVGQVMRPHCRVIRTKTKRRIFRRMQMKVKEYKKGIISDEEFRQSLQSYLGHLSHGANYKVRQRLCIEVSRKLFRYF